MEYFHAKLPATMIYSIPLEDNSTSHYADFQSLAIMIKSDPTVQQQ